MGDSTRASDNTEAGTTSAPESKPASGGALSKLNKFLEDSDLTNPAVGRMLLDRIEKLEQDVAELKPFREKFHSADKRAEVCSTRLFELEKSVTGRNILFAFGGILAGFLPSLWSRPKFFVVAVVVCFVLFGMAILGGRKKV